MTTTTFCSEIDSPLGQLVVLGDGQFVTGLYMPKHKGWNGPDPSWRQSDTSFNAVREQLAEYFAGERQSFDLPIKALGSTFQQQVWNQLIRIPYGTTITYGQLAERVGNPDASRAVGNANGCNPISIIVPCHRVIGTSGKLTGYAGGLDKKQWLINWERGLTAAEQLDLFDPTRSSGRNLMKS